MTPRAPTPAPAAKKSNRELLPAVIVIALGAPLVFMFARAMADGEVRRREAPVRAFIGDSDFARLSRGEKTEQHYMGSELSAPDFSLPDRNGRMWKLSDHRGKVVVMNFWTITCQPCIEEMPSLIQLARSTAGRSDVEVVAVTTDKSWDDVKAVLPPDSGLTVLFDPGKQVVEKKFGSRLFPETWIIDGDGLVRLRVDGPRDWAGALSLDVIDGYL